MAKATLGTAYLAILPETSQLTKSIRKTTRRMERSFSGVGRGLTRSLNRSITGFGKGAGSQGRSIGSRMGSGMSGGLTRSLGGAFTGITRGVSDASQRAGQSMVTILKGAAGTAAAGVAGVMAVSLGSGFTRLTNIDQATSKLGGLGNSAEDIDKIMSNANASVKGTAFGLDEAATVAASAVASGIDPGEKLEQVLTTIGDTAAIAGLEIGSVGSIFNSVLARGKLMGDDMLQLTSQGVPVGKFLADEMGVAQEAVSDMVSAGEVDFETFEKAMREGLGGAALAAGDTVSGGAKNMRAAMGRFGATLLDPVFKNSPPIFNAIGTAFDSMEEAITPAMERLSERMAPAVEDLADRIENRLPGMIEKSIPRIREGFSWIRDRFTFLRDSVFPILQTIGEKFISAFTAVEPYIPNVVNLAQGIWTTVQPYISQIQSGFQTIGEYATTAFTAVQPYIPTIQEAFGFLQERIQGMVDALEPHLPAIKAWFETIAGYAQTIGENIFAAFDPSRVIRQGVDGEDITMGDVFAGIFETIERVVPQLLELVPPLTEIIGMLLSSLSEVSVGLWTAFIQILESILPIVLLVVQAAQPLMSAIASFMQENPGMVTALVTALVGFKAVGVIAGPVSKAARALGKMWGSVKKFGKKGKTWWQGGSTASDGTIRGKSGQFINAEQMRAQSVPGRVKDWGSSVKAGGLKGGSKIVGKTALKGVGKAAKGALRFLGPWGIALSIFLEVLPWIIENWDKIIGVFKWAWEQLKKIGNWIKDFFQALWDVAKRIWDDIVGFFKNVWDGIKKIIEWFKGIPDFMGRLKDGVVEGMKGVFEALLSPFKKAFEWISDSWIGDVGRKIGELGSAIGGFFGFGSEPETMGAGVPVQGNGLSRMAVNEGISLLRANSSTARTMASRSPLVAARNSSVYNGGGGSGSGQGAVVTLESRTYSDQDVAEGLSILFKRMGIHDTQIKMMSRSMRGSAVGYHKRNK